MSAIILTDSVAMESKRKAFVRKFVERNMKRCSGGHARRVKRRHSSLTPCATSSVTLVLAA